MKGVIFVACIATILGSSSCVAKVSSPTTQPFKVDKQWVASSLWSQVPASTCSIEQLLKGVYTFAFVNKATLSRNQIKAASQKVQVFRLYNGVELHFGNCPHDHHQNVWDVSSSESFRESIKKLFELIKKQHSDNTENGSHSEKDKHEGRSLFQAKPSTSVELDLETL